MSLTMHDWTAGPHARHRWIVLVPVLVVLVALTIREGAVREASPEASSLRPEHVSADQTASYAVEDDGTIALKGGSLLAYDPGFASVRAGEWDVAIWGGGAYVSFQESGLTVAAFDLPVIVRGAKGVAVIPSMHQWRAPRGYLPDAGSDPVAWMDALDLRPLPEHFAREHAQSIAAWRTEEEGEARVANVAASVLGSATTADLADAALRSRPTRPLAAAVRFNAELRLHGLVHPSFRDAAWGFAPVADGAPDDESWIATLLLPRLERSNATASPLTVRRWGETLRAAFDASSDPDTLKSAVLPAMEREITGMADDGYPVRALRFAQALREAVGTGASLSLDARASYDRLDAMTPESLRASVLADLTPIAPVIEEHVEASVQVVADPALEQLARERLAAHGAMFTKQSSVKTAGEGIVDVEGVVFALSSGDRALRFRYNPEADAAQAIIDGQAQPYAVPLRAYLEWEAGR